MIKSPLMSIMSVEIFNGKYGTAVGKKISHAQNSALRNLMIKEIIHEKGYPGFRLTETA